MSEPDHAICFSQSHVLFTTSCLLPVVVNKTCDWLNSWTRSRDLIRWSAIGWTRSRDLFQTIARLLHFGYYENKFSLTMSKYLIKTGSIYFIFKIWRKKIHLIWIIFTFESIISNLFSFFAYKNSLDSHQKVIGERSK